MGKRLNYLALGGGRGHLAHIFLVFGLGGVLCQFVEDVGAGRVHDVQVVCEGSTVGGGTGKRMLFVGLLCKTKQKNLLNILNRIFTL